MKTTENWACNYFAIEFKPIQNAQKQHKCWKCVLIFIEMSKNAAGNKQMENKYYLYILYVNFEDWTN